MVSKLRTFTSRIRGMFSQRREDEEFSDEIREHLDLLTEENVRRGMPLVEARREAKIRLGGLVQLRETHHELTGLFFLETLFQDIRYALRMLRRSPGFTAVAVLTLALGIGANTAVFSLVEAVLLKPLPYPGYARIVVPLRQTPPTLNLGYNEIPWGLRDVHFLESSTTYQAVGAFYSDSFNLTGAGEPIRLDGLRASAGFFSALGVSPAIGRTYTTEEDQAGHEHEVVLSHQLWLDKFGGTASILGRPIELNGAAYTVIGVMPAGFVFPRSEEMPASFDFPREAELWVPLALPATALHPWDPDIYAVIARLKPGETINHAQAEMDLYAKRMEKLIPRGKGWFNSRVTPLARLVAGDTREPLLLILGAVSVFLLIACSNVASLLLARALERRREFTLRAALGAGHGRLIRQLLTESTVLAVAGGILGVVFCGVAIHFAKIFGPSNIPRLQEAGVDARVLLFALGISMLTGILFGLAPAMGASRGNLQQSLKESEARSGGSSSGFKVRRMLLVSQVAFSFVLVVAAGLLARTLFYVLRADGGFRPEHVLTFELTLSPGKYTDNSKVVSFYRSALERLRTLPGAESAGITEVVPLGGAPDSTAIRFANGYDPRDKAVPIASYALASPGYFSAAGTPLLRGREFADSDTATSAPVVIINSAMAKRFWPGQDPIGKQVAPRASIFPLATIVGIAANTKYLSMREEPGPLMYVPYNQKTYLTLFTMQAIVRTVAAPASIIGGVREAIRSVDPDVPITNVSTLEEARDKSVAQTRFAVIVLATFAMLALALASIGLYGVISYAVVQRTHEIGIRMALGAHRRNVFAMVLGEGARLAAIGLGVGLAAALGVARLLTHFLYGVQPTDPATFAGVSLLLLGVALAACYIPARRAMKVDPMVALRYE